MVVGKSIRAGPGCARCRRVVAPRIDPVETLADHCAAEPPHHEVAHRGVRPSVLIDAAVLACGALHLGGARAAVLLVETHGAGKIVGRRREALRQHSGILDRHGRALRKERQHRVGGIAEQGNLIAAPLARHRQFPPAPISATAPACRAGRAHGATSARLETAPALRRASRARSSRSRSRFRRRSRRC